MITFKRPNSVTNLVTDLDTPSNKEQDLSDKHKEVLAYYVVARSSREFLEHIGVANHTKNRDKSINNLEDEGYLERTIPNVPNLPKQKYIVRKK